MKTTLLTCIVSIALAFGCGKKDDDNKTDKKPDIKDQKDPAPKPDPKPEAKVTTFVAEIQATGDVKVSGTVVFTEKDGQVQIEAKVTGLTAGQKHGFHIHEKGDCGDGGKAAGGHFDPHGTKHHGKPDADKRHAGDLGNLEADDKGNASLATSSKLITLGAGDNSIAGRGVIVHAKEDVFEQPTGAAGGRIGCGVIKKK